MAYKKITVVPAKWADKALVEKCLDLQINGDPKNLPKNRREKNMKKGNIRCPDYESGCPSCE